MWGRPFYRRKKWHSPWFEERGMVWCAPPSTWWCWHKRALGSPHPRLPGQPCITDSVWVCWGSEWLTHRSVDAGLLVCCRFACCPTWARWSAQVLSCCTAGTLGSFPGSLPVSRGNSESWSMGGRGGLRHVCASFTDNWYQMQVAA